VKDYTFNAEMYIDGERVETSNFPTKYKLRKQPPFWHYQLKRGKHKVRIKIMNPTVKEKLALHHPIIYDNQPRHPKY